MPLSYKGEAKTLGGGVKDVTKNAGQSIASNFSSVMHAQGHGIIINMSSLAPFTFFANPESIETNKKINYSQTPNIGGAFKKKYFSGFDTKEVTFNLVCLDMEAPTGVMEEIAFFEQLREPDSGLFNFFSLYGNQNFPPPQVLFWFGASYLPLVWDVMNITINETHFHSGAVRGIIGVPKRCEISMTLSLDEESAINKANQIAKKAAVYAASIKSSVAESAYKNKSNRKEMPGIYPKRLKIDRRY